jgi:hypothetical protein
MKKAKATLLALSVIAHACAASNSSTEVLSPPEIFTSAPRITSPSQYPKLIRRRDPLAPRELTDIPASAVAEIYVSASGDVVGTWYLSGSRTLFEAVAVAASDWKFEPFTVEGHPTAFVLPLNIALTWHAGPIRAEITMKVASDVPRD